ncbi:Agrin [Liparis tanakae]|uniref:Agrin n=1 Tax=Liparis tanakae TaxID=230148 RepID=A0A4Z2E5F6_9TELE|nr:Agrin [Liparis tanakae]
MEGRGSLEWSMSGCHYPASPQEQDRRYRHKVSLVVRYFMIPCNICLILLAVSTLGLAVLLFLNNCTLRVDDKQNAFGVTRPADRTVPGLVVLTCVCVCVCVCVCA